MIKLVAFLGNYGKEYEKTRHNVSWYFEDSLPFAGKLSWQNKFKGEIASFTPQELSQWACDTKICSKKDGSPVLVPEESPSHIYFLKPLTFMNLSGDSIIEVANFYKIQPSEIMVVHDELELEPGFVSLKWSGGLGGHNGLRSTKAVLNTPDFFRLRFGIGRPDNDNIGVADWVLSRFTAEQQELMQNVFSQTNLLLVKVLLSKEPKDLVQGWGKKKLI
ncbi:MAG: aminoacyl-tRNA hydrolase [Treponema sp.]|nr:aminoacyl-tRNA hydrolase [Spirochaetia bacterium]MDD7534838.1 aminoacyl-tRNA hydrolase [Treponema sp.]MDY3722904.1 aminoacyl-tRNA hydrolase [Treponema sp.]MDY5758211.1 aminoacyl-tRNA hydrolase [Treponema sp.]MDY5818653.1 aminoacyl-tRNA hydrolase [Treponema sp.]